MKRADDHGIGASLANQRGSAPPVIKFGALAIETSVGGPKGKWNDCSDGGRFGHVNPTGAATRVDGNMIKEQHLAGKPAPDTFLTAAKLLLVEPRRAVIIEDAISGVQAGSDGNFGLVIGVARKGNAEELKHHGAHLVVNDLAELVD
jgi:hypothetical protein